MRLSVAAARVLTLSLLAASAMAQAPGGDGLVFRRIWRSGDDSAGTLVLMGPPGAGRYLPRVEYATGQLTSYDLQRGEWTRVTGGDSTVTYGGIEQTVVSPDGNQFAYIRPAYFNNGNAQLRIVERGGRNDHVLRTILNGRWIWNLTWIPDGSGIVTTEMPGGVSRPVEIVLTSTTDGDARILERYENTGIGPLFISTDGRYVAYDVTPEGSDDADIYTLDLRGGEPTGVVRGNGHDQIMGWAPDGSGIFYYSNRELRHAIWHLPVVDGHAGGAPRLIRDDVWSLVPLGFSGSQYFYRVVREGPQVRTATLDLDAGHLVNPPVPIREPWQPWSGNPAWSPDGRYLAFLDFATNVPWEGAQARLGIRSVHTGETRYLPFPFAPGADPWWRPDARTMTIFGQYRNQPGVYQLDLQSGAVTALVPRDSTMGESGFGLSPDGKTAYFHRDRNRIVALDLTTGRETILAEVEGLWRRIAVSPDGKTLVVRAGGCFEESRLLVLPATGGEPREIYRGMHLGCSDFLAIGPDSKFVVAAVFPAAIWRFSMQGGEPVKLLDGENPRGFDMSLDGRRIAYWDLPNGQGNWELWVIEGLVGRGRR